ncbi:MAG: PDZ domain-containing protein [Anaerolineae bacterium]|nr:PDZ domain-containing protein [Anaerolineae bacterium]
MKRQKPVIVLIAIVLASLACGTSQLDSLVATDIPEPSPMPTGESAGVMAPESDSDIPPAVVVNDEGGPVVLHGEVTYTNYFFTAGVAQPIVILEDQAGFVDRDRTYVMPVASQTLGQITSDFYTSPFTYSLALPIEPQGALRDVDNDGESDTGVMVFAVAYWTNTWGDPFLEERDLGGGGWSTAYASTITSEEYETEREIIGGKLLVYAPDDRQAFPSEFGADGLLFTDDDPVVMLPQGYTIVDLNVEPFLFDRSQEPQIDLHEPEGSAMDDFSSMSYTDAFDAMVDKMSKEYAFTEYKGIDWNALHNEFYPRFEEAERSGDYLTYMRALRDFIWQIPDTHVSGGFVVEDFWDLKGGALGFNIRETDDDHTYVTTMLDGSPADNAGIKIGAEIFSFDGTPISDVVSATTAWFGPHSSPHTYRLDQLLFAVRFPPDTEVEVEYQNPDQRAIQTATLRAVEETESLFAGYSGGDLTGFELPVEYEVLDGGIVHATIYGFLDDELLTIKLWERLMQTLNETAAPGLIIDMRLNSGGSGFLADEMAAYFFDDELALGNTGYYDEKLDTFTFDEQDMSYYILPPEDLRYHGNVVVLISPDCVSACEFFSYDMTLEDRATLIGYYPTAGAGGSVEVFTMPEDQEISFTIGRAVDANGNIHIEGTGVLPDIDVPVTEESLVGDRDVLLDTALDYLLGR